MRTINEPRDKLHVLRQQLEDLNAIDGLGLGWSEGNRDEAAEAIAAEAIQHQIPDALWQRFCESVDKRVARLAVQGGSPAHTAPSSPVKDMFPNERGPGTVNFDDYGLTQSNWGEVIDLAMAPESLP
jgi:hypothetical protein